MIELTKLNGETFFLNPHQIEYMEAKPDMTLTMLSGKRLVIKEDYDTIYNRIIDYRKLIGSLKNEE